MSTITTKQQAEPAQELDVYSYAALLATTIHAKHYKDTAPQWKPLPDLLGVLTQIDNMTAGLTRQPEPSESSCDECGKSKADGWALYCVECLEQFFRPTEPAQEPVAVALHTGTKQGIKWHREVEHGTPLYTAPPQRPPLTEEEIWEVYYNLPESDFEGSDRVAFARAIERKVRGETE